MWAILGGIVGGMLTLLVFLISSQCNKQDSTAWFMMTLDLFCLAPLGLISRGLGHPLVLSPDRDPSALAAMTNALLLAFGCAVVASWRKMRGSGKN